MHDFLRAIGFGQIKKRKEVDQLLGTIIEDPTEKKITQINDKEKLAEIRKDFGTGIGIMVRGIYDEKGFFYVEHYFPYLRPTVKANEEEIYINRRIDTDAYTGMCDDFRLGVSLIFYLQNTIDYLEASMTEGVSRIMPVVFSALSVQGKILLGIDTSEEEKKDQSIKSSIRKNLIKEAKNGNQEALESLTIDEMDTYSMISRRIMVEDLYSIVESTFIPFGSESDNYSIIGTILNWKLVRNHTTREKVYVMLLDCNDIQFCVCINSEDLQGEPMIGRRFKGNVWMQGEVDFQTTES